MDMLIGAGIMWFGTLFGAIIVIASRSKDDNNGETKV